MRCTGREIFDYIIFGDVLEHLHEPLKTMQYCKWGDSADLFLLAIGPSSGVLAFDLALKNFQAIDVGHIDLEYEWFLAGKGIRVPVPHKYNNEISGGDVVNEFHDLVYDSQMIAFFA